MADGDQVIIPSSGKSISKVTVTKPDTLISANILNDVVIGGVTGTLDPNASKIAFIEDGWSDDDVLCENGFGVARIREHGIEIQIWSDASDCQLPLDDGYEAFFRNLQPQTIISNTSLCTRLAEFCEYIVTNKKNEFNSIFTGATKACFMDNDHPVDIPTLTTSTPATTDGFMSALANVLAGFPSYIEYGFMKPTDYGENISDGGQIQPRFNAIMPFIWYPAVEDGEPKIVYYSLQDPTGTMTTYTNGFNVYNLSLNDMKCTLGYVNAVPSAGVTSNFIAFIVDGIVWWSDGAQTIPSAFLQNMDTSWTYGDVVLVAGWNITTNVGEGTNTTIQMPDEYKQVVQIAPDELLLSEMDNYEKSVFTGVTKQPYKRFNQNHISVKFVLRNKEHGETNSAKLKMAVASVTRPENMKQVAQISQSKLNVETSSVPLVAVQADTQLTGGFITTKAEGVAFELSETVKTRAAMFVDGTLERVEPDDFGSLTALPEGAFSYSPYKSIYMSSNIKSAPDNILSLNMATAYVKCSPNVSKIGSWSALHYSSLETITLDCTDYTSVPTKNGGFGFNKIIVPSNLLTKWKATSGWSDISDKIVAG